MKFRIIFSMMFLFVVHSTFAAISSAGDQLVFLLQKTKTFKADFVQHTFDQKNTLIQTSEGLMQFKRPGKFRWDTLKPSRQVVITNNQWLWVYDIDLMQVTKQSIKKASVTPARVLSGDTKQLLSRFKVTLKRKRNEMDFLLLPRNSQAAFKQVGIIFYEGVLKKLSILNQLGQKNTFDFSAVQINLPLNNALFEFTPPAGVDVLKS